MHSETPLSVKTNSERLLINIGVIRGNILCENATGAGYFHFVMRILFEGGFCGRIPMALIVRVG